MSAIRERLHREEGATLAEYTLILAFVALGAIFSVGAVGAAVLGLYESAGDAFP